VALLQRLYDPDEGMVLVDGVDLREVDAGWYRAQIGVVSQVCVWCVCMCVCVRVCVNLYWCSWCVHVYACVYACACV